MLPEVFRLGLELLLCHAGKVFDLRDSSVKFVKPVLLLLLAVLALVLDLLALADERIVFGEVLLLGLVAEVFDYLLLEMEFRYDFLEACAGFFTQGGHFGELGLVALRGQLQFVRGVHVGDRLVQRLLQLRASRHVVGVAVIELVVDDVVEAHLRIGGASWIDGHFLVP